MAPPVACLAVNGLTRNEGGAPRGGGCSWGSEQLSLALPALPASFEGPGLLLPGCCSLIKS